MINNDNNMEWIPAVVLLLSAILQGKLIFVSHFYFSGVNITAPL